MEKYREIERSIIKKYRKEIWSKFIKAIKDYELIQENDNIMVCISVLFSFEHTCNKDFLDLVSLPLQKYLF